MNKSWFVVLNMLLLSLSFECAAQIQKISLSNESISAIVTPDIGGRLLHLSLPEHDNFLLLGEEVITEPSPYVSPMVETIGYLGGEVWVGPQSAWWKDQKVNITRKQNNAEWPPDPYLTLAKYQLLNETKNSVVMLSPASAVSGVQFKKIYTLDKKHDGGLLQVVEATNFRDSAVAWDLWFNTRVSASTKVYVPVDSAKQVRINQITDDFYDVLTPEYDSDFLSLTAHASSDKKGRRGKLFIQPNKGFVAAFKGNQLMLAVFDLLPKTLIHTEQGQVELYLQFANDDIESGLFEIELHGEYAVREAKETFSLEQRFILLPYKGKATSEAHIAYLQSLKFE
jgi:hypothetical protein